MRVSGLELGGLLGSLVAGRISDWYISKSGGGAVGKRIQVVMGYLVGVAAMLVAFRAVPTGDINHHAMNVQSSLTFVYVRIQVSDSELISQHLFWCNN